MEVRAVAAAQMTNCGSKSAGDRRTGGLSRFALLALASTALTVPGAAWATPMTLILEGNYIKIGLSEVGTLGSTESNPPGILYDGTGTGTFNASYDYLTPGTPFEGFTVKGTATSGFTNTNNNASSRSSNPLAGTLTDYSGVAFGGETFDNRAVWEGTETGVYTISHDYRFDEGGQQLVVVTTITALTDLTGLSFARFTDPDARAASGDSSSTNNFAGANGVSANDLVYAEALVSKYVIGLYSNSTVTHKAGVTNWSSDPAAYISGTNIGNGDYTIGLGFDIGSLLTGDSIVLNYSYIFGTNIANAISDAGASGGTTPTSGPTQIDAGQPATVEGLLSGDVLPVFDGGTLTLSNGGEVDKDFTVKSTGGGIDTGGKELALTGEITGGGVLTKKGAGTLVLSGTNTHGGFNVEGGTLAINNENALGDVNHIITLSGDGALKALKDMVLPNPFSINTSKSGVLDTGGHILTISGPIIGGGTLNKSGEGVLILSGANDFKDLNINQGTVSVSNSASLGGIGGNIILNGSAALNLTTNLTITKNIEIAGTDTKFDTGANTVLMLGALSGKNCFTKVGAGSLNLMAAASNDIGACVEQGALSINNIFTGKVWVDPNATLGGSGKINGSVIVAGKGVLSPGNSPGQLVVAGAVTMASDSVLALDIDGPTAGIGAGHYDTLVLTGADGVFTAAGTVAPILRGITGSANNTYTPNIGDAFQVVSAEGGVTGTFAGVTQPTAGMPVNTRFDVVYLPKAVVLAVTAKSYAALNVGVANARSAGAVADALRPAAGSRGANSFTDGLAGLKEAQLAAVLQQASGEVHADAVEGQLQAQRAARGQISGRLADGLSTNRRVWGEYAYDSFKLDGDADAGGFDADRNGMIFGVDGKVSPTLLVGAAFSYGETKLDAENIGSSRTESYQGHVYATWRSGDYYVNGLVSAGTDQYKTNRRVGLSTGAKAYYGRADGSSIAGDLEAGRDIAFGATKLTLAAGLASDRVKRDSLDETGDAVAALRFGGETRQALQGRIGAKISTKALMGEMKVAPRAALFVTQEFDDTATRLDASLQGRGFAVTTADSGRTAVNLGTAVDASLTERLRVGVGYQYGWSDGGESHAARIRAAITW